MKKWGILVHLGRNMWGDLRAQKKLNFDLEVWNKVVDKCVEHGLNTIIMDVGEGVVYPSHPELAIEDSWTSDMIKKEVIRLREKGIELVPKLDFSANHDAWLGEYERMISTPVYYKVCKELIEDVYEMFLHPSFIHIGMDEEDKNHAYAPGHSMTILRHDELLVHDINYLIKCVENTGAQCHMWHDPMCSIDEKYASKISDTVIPEIWMYYSYIRENWSKVSDEPEYVQYYYKTTFVRNHGYEIEYVEEDPFVQDATKLITKCMETKRPFIATSSNFQVNYCDINTIRFIMEHDPDFEAFQGMINAPWCATTKEKEAALLEAVELLGEAKRVAHIFRDQF